MEEEGETNVGALRERINSLNIREEESHSNTVENKDDEDRVAELKERFRALVTKAKNKSRDGDFEESLMLFKRAYKIHKSEKVAKRIKILEEILQASDNDSNNSEDSDQYVTVADGFKLSKHIYTKLYPHQKEGMLWFWRLFTEKKGGILGDDMGLGKTIQVISFLSGMFEQDYIKTALIVMPVSLLTIWEKELKKWAPEIRVGNFHGPNLRQRSVTLGKIQSRNGVCLTTYGMMNTCFKQFSEDKYGREFTWDYIILDEGHKIKNTANKTTQSIRAIPACHHFILTGTPIQNNLREMWALFDFVCEGRLLGTSRSFKQEYENPIVRARERDATAYEKRIGQEMSQHLRELIAPHFLRRTKAILEEKPKGLNDEVDGNVPESETRDNAQPEDTEGEGAKTAKLTRKNDLIIWLHLSDTQLRIYSDFVQLERVKEILMTTKSPLAELNVLKKICDHPRLLSTMACQQLGLSEEQEDFDGDYCENYELCAPPVEVLIEESGKMVFLVQLLRRLKEEGHRTLVFSQSRKMLDIIMKVLAEKHIKMMRVDGTITSIAERESRINKFQTDPSYSVFLLTTQVGGVGLTLTAADRVVIFDPSWNPATDAQAVDRVYRIGQKNTVVVYRLITCGSLEEKIYRKQVFKQAITKQTTGSSKNPYRYFTRQELRELFVLDNPKSSKTQIQLAKMHSANRVSDPELDEHLAFLHTTGIFGLSDHDLLFTQEAVATEEEMHAASEMGDVIQAKIRRAADIMRAESNQAAEQRALKSVSVTPSVSKKGQTKIPDHLEVFAPSREDSKRFMPAKIKAVRPADVVDITVLDDRVNTDALGEQLSSININGGQKGNSDVGAVKPEQIVVDEFDDDIRTGVTDDVSDGVADGRRRVVPMVHGGHHSNSFSEYMSRAETSENERGDDVISVETSNAGKDDIYGKKEKLFVGDSLQKRNSAEPGPKRVTPIPCDDGGSDEDEEYDGGFGAVASRVSRKNERHVTESRSVVIEDEDEEERGSDSSKEMDGNEGNARKQEGVALGTSLCSNKTNSPHVDLQARQEAKYRVADLYSTASNSGSDEENDSDCGIINKKSVNAGKILESDSESDNNDQNTTHEGDSPGKVGTYKQARTRGTDSDHDHDHIPIENTGRQEKTEGFSKFSSPEVTVSDDNDDVQPTASPLIATSEGDDGDVSDGSQQTGGSEDAVPIEHEVLDNECEVGGSDDEMRVSKGKVEAGEDDIDDREDDVGDSEDKIVDSEDEDRSYEDKVVDSECEVGDTEDEVGDSEGEGETVEDTEGESDSEHGSDVDDRSIGDNESLCKNNEVGEDESVNTVDSEGESVIIVDSENEIEMTHGDRNSMMVDRDGEGDESGGDDDREIGRSKRNASSGDGNGSRECERAESHERKNRGSNNDSVKPDDNEHRPKTSKYCMSGGRGDKEAESSHEKSHDSSGGGMRKAKHPVRKLRQVVSEDESDSDEENVSQPQGLPGKEQAPQKVMENESQSQSQSPGMKTTCCPRGKHVSKIAEVRRCPCVMSLDEQEAYKMHISTARQYEKSGQLQLALKHYHKGYRLCDSDDRLRQKMVTVFRAVKPSHKV